MIQFNDIKLHDLVFLDGSNSLDFDNDGEIDGWHVVTGISRRASFFTAAPLGDMDHSVYVDDMDIVRKHIRAAAVPGAIEALERIENGVTTTDSYGTQMALSDWDMEDIARAALRAVRGEGISGETHRTSIPTPDESHAD